MQAAKQQCDHLAAAFQQAGYTVQTIHIVSNPFGEYLNTESAAAAKQGLAAIEQILTQINQSGLRIRFAIGLCNACVNVDIDANGFLDKHTIVQCAQTVQQIARLTPRGEGNFNFTVNFNCPPLIP